MAEHRGKADATRKHPAEQLLDVDSEPAHHVAVAGARADHHAEPRAVHEGVHAECQCNAGNRREDAVDRVGHHAAERHVIVQPPGNTAHNSAPYEAINHCNAHFAQDQKRQVPRLNIL